MESRRIGECDYVLLPHRAIGALADPVYGLTRLAFGTYLGVLVPSREHRAWYVRRPGMDDDLSTAVVCGGVLVASVFVTVARVTVGGRLLRVGIVDTVMTHPEHRRRGLARWALTTAIAGMRRRDLQVSLLYTVADSMPFRLYESLGYVPHAPVRYYGGTPEATAPHIGEVHARPMRPGEDASVRTFVDACLCERDGAVPLDPPLWRWRHQERPAELPATVWLVEGPAGRLACVTVCRAPIVTAGDPAECYVLTEVALAGGADPRVVLRALMATVPRGAELRALAAESDPELCLAFEGLGLRALTTETAMLLPLDEGACAALAAPPRAWVPLTESIVGL